MTIQQTKPVAPAATSPRVPVWAIALPVLIVLLAAGGGWLLLRPGSPAPQPTREIALQPVIAPPQTDAPPVPVPVTPAREAEPEPRGFTIEAATEQGILHHVQTDAAEAVAVFRFAANPRVMVLDFRSLRDQGRMLNRTAALVEKTGLPHDRLLNDSELDAAVRAGGDTAETFYYGHDYSAASLLRFFALADRDDVKLLSDETTLRNLIRQEGWFAPDARAALISITQAGADEHVTLPARATILHHELSHGEYFTNPAYAAFVHRFWGQTLGSGERDRVRRHLRTLGYDAALDDVMENEAQAYLMFTDGKEFFTPDMVGMSKARLTELRNGFYRSMPGGWLRDSLGQSLSIDKTTAAAPP